VTLRRPRPLPEYEETLRSCLGEVQRVQGLTEELLELARIDTQQEAEAARPVPVSEIVEAAVSAVTSEAERRGILVLVEDGPEMLVNAAPVAAKVALANIVVITVSDSGPGVSPDDVPRLFQRFYRGKASRASDVPGVGLGLAISRALIERQGGRISVETAGEKGATFIVHLPLA
jgi:two-component system OmpR family sensor kinase